MEDAEAYISAYGNVIVKMPAPYDGQWAEMDGDPSVEDLEGIDGAGWRDRFLALVKRWNFRPRGGGEVLPISDEGARRLPIRQLPALKAAYVASFAEPLPNVPGSA